MIHSPKTTQSLDKVDTRKAQETELETTPTPKKEKPSSELNADGFNSPQPTQVPQPLTTEQTAGLNPPNGAKPQHQAPNIQSATTPQNSSVSEDILYGIEELASGEFDIEFLPGESKEQAYTRTFALYTGIDLREIDPQLRAPLIKCMAIIGTHKPANKAELLRNEKRLIATLELIVTHLETRHGRDMHLMRQTYQVRHTNFSVDTATVGPVQPLTEAQIAAFNLFMGSLSADDLEALMQYFDQYHEKTVGDCEAITTLEEPGDTAAENAEKEIQSDIFVHMLVNNQVHHDTVDEMLDQLKDAAKDHAQTIANIRADTKEYKKRIHLAARELQRLLKAGKHVGGGLSGLGTP